MKKMFPILLLLCALYSTQAQNFTPPDYAEVNHDYRNYVNQVFGALETNRVTTGLLLDYGFDFADPKMYNGTVLADSTLMGLGKNIFLHPHCYINYNV
jgi:hypothetical protein